MTREPGKSGTTMRKLRKIINVNHSVKEIQLHVHISQAFLLSTGLGMEQMGARGHTEQSKPNAVCGSAKKLAATLTCSNKDQSI